MTNQQYYYGLNRRFDKRARILVKHGFHCDNSFIKHYIGDNLAIGSIAYFIRQNPITKLRLQIIPNSTVMHASNREWIDTLARELTR